MHGRVSGIAAFILGLSIFVCGQAFASTVTYLFNQTDSSNGFTATGEIVFAAPPANAAAGWSSLSGADLVDWRFSVETVSFGTQAVDPSNFNLAFYEFDYDNPQSLSGDALDNGGFGYDAPLIADELTILFSFLSSPGDDSVVISAFTLPGTFVGSYSGDWQVAPVPLPGAAWLFGAALLGLAGFGRRRKSVR